jgi:hypothetical protein
MNLDQALALASRFEEDGVIGTTAQALRTVATEYRKVLAKNELTERYARALELLANSGV